MSSGPISHCRNTTLEIGVPTRSILAVGLIASGATARSALNGGDLPAPPSDPRSKSAVSRRFKRLPFSLETYPFDAADSLDTREEQADFLAEGFASGDSAVVTAALGMIARARGIGQLARETGLRCEALYKATGPEGNPTLATLMGIMRATGLKLSAGVR